MGEVQVRGDSGRAERAGGHDGEEQTAGLCLQSRLLEVGSTEYPDGFDAGAR